MAPMISMTPTGPMVPMVPIMPVTPCDVHVPSDAHGPCDVHDLHDAHSPPVIPRDPPAPHQRWPLLPAHHPLSALSITHSLGNALCQLGWPEVCRWLLDAEVSHQGVDWGGQREPEGHSRLKAGLCPLAVQPQALVLLL